MLVVIVAVAALVAARVVHLAVALVAHRVEVVVAEINLNVE